MPQPIKCSPLDANDDRVTDSDAESGSRLTSNQQLIWLGQELNPDLPLYNMIQTFSIAGPVDPGTFEAAFRSLVNASDALRTTIDVVDDVPRQKAAKTIEWQLDFIDLSGAADTVTAWSEWLQERRVRVLDLNERLFDCALIKRGDKHFVWYLCQHHLITDGHSFALTFRYMAERYALAAAGELSDAPSLPPYADYISQEREFLGTAAHREAVDHWRQQLDSPGSKPDFYGRGTDAAALDTKRLVLDLGTDRSAALHDIAGSEDFASLSANLTLHSLWATLILATLHRISGERAIRLGMPLESRPTPVNKQTMGLFIEIGLLTATIDRDATFPSLNADVMERVFEGLRYGRPGISSAEMNNAYSVLLNYVTASMDDFAGWPVETEWVHAGFGDREHALRIQVCDFDRSGRFVLHVDVNETVFDESRQQWLISQLTAVIDAFIEDPGRPIGSFDLLTESERRRFVEDFNRSDSHMTDAPSVVELFQSQVSATPDTAAVYDGERTLTYRAFNARANQFAAWLADRGIGRGSRIAISMPRSTDFLVAVWGVIKSGAAFTPIDPGNPGRRLQEIIQDLDPALFVTHRGAGGDPQLAVPTVDPSTLDLDNLPTANPPLDIRPDDVAYFIYTSGSTGLPKAAMLSHGGLLNYVAWAAETYLQNEPHDFALYSSIAFDLTLTSIFAPLTAGGAIRIYPDDDTAAGLEILKVFEDDAVDAVKLTPAHLELLRNHGVQCRRIARLILGGEDLKTRAAASFLQSAGREIQIYNEYGPTEATVGCMVYQFDPRHDRGPSVPIGRPAANMRIYLRDEYDQPVPSGVIGEMMIAGSGVAVGYWKRDGLTAERFGMDSDESGSRRLYRTGDLARWGAAGLEFLGRADDQVKLRGARIELGEIENTLLEHPSIESAAVTLQKASRAKYGTLTHCNVCGLPSNYPNANFDSSGVCTDCRDYAILKPEVDRYFGTAEQLEARLEKVRSERDGQNYDCIVLTSGGKDSTYMLYQLVRRFGIRPLVFTLDNGYLSERAIANVRLACEELGVDLEIASTPHMNEIFADSLQRHCNVCNGCFKTIYTLSMTAARRLGISTIITGLSRGQMFETRLADTFRARQFDPEKIDRLIVDARKVYHQVNDAVYEHLDTGLFDDERTFDDIGFVDFYRYLDVGLDEVYHYLENETTWQRPDDTGRSTNCKINDAGIYVHKQRRGYHNYALPYSWDVRLGHKERAAAMQELDDAIDETNVRRILDDIGYDATLSDDATTDRLVAYFVGDAEQQAVKAFLAEHLPAYMVPSQVVCLDAMPLTSNGKIDRRRLPDADLERRELETRYVAPSTPTETCLARIWGDVMDISRIGVNDNFFELGGDSVMTIRIAAQARSEGLEMSPRQLFSAPTIAQLAVLVASSASDEETLPSTAFDPATAADIERLREHIDEETFADFEDIYPLTPIQAGLLYHAITSPESGYYVGQVSCALDGTIDVDAIREAWQRTIARHPALRTRFFWDWLDSPLQAVCRTGEPTWQVLDWRDGATVCSEKELEALREALMARGFDLQGDALMRFTLVLEADDRAHLIWDVHHILLDGWSAYPVFNEWLEIYDAIVTNESAELPPPRPFVDYVRWQSVQDKALSDAFWRDYLKGFDTATPLAQTTRYGTGSRTKQLELELDPVETSALEDLARKFRVTLNSVFQAAWAVLVSRYTGSDDVVFGTSVSGRNVVLPGIDDIVGLLLNSLPVRLEVPPQVCVGDWLPAVQDAFVALGEYEWSALSDIHRVSELPSDQELFDNLLVFENYPSNIERSNRSLASSSLKFNAPSHYPLAVLIYPEAKIRCSFIYKPARFPTAMIERMAAGLRTVLAAMAANPDTAIGDLDVLPSADREQLLSDWNPPRLPETPQLLVDQIAQQSLSNPHAAAVSRGNERLSYAELEARANGLALRLKGAGVAIGDRVAVEVARSADAVVAMLGIWKAGAAFVPLDPDYPESHVTAIVADSEAKFLVTAGALSIDIGIPCIELGSLTAGRAVEMPAPQSDDLAYVLYTSGSTGRPKGVMVSHGNIAASTAARRDYYPDRVERFMMLPSFAFDSSMAGLFWTLCDGGELLLPDVGRHLDVVHLAQIMHQRRVSHVLTLPSFFEALLEAADVQQFGSLRTAIVAGEPCRPTVFANLARVCPQADLYNEYGPTEGTVWSHVYRFPKNFDDDVVPIGKPVAHVRQYILDTKLRPVPIGVPGELVLGGAGIAKGYLNDGALTADRFIELSESVGVPGAGHCYRTGDLVRRRENGDLEFLGRTDEQIKVRGVRVEPAEIEATLTAHPDIDGAVVVKTEGRANQLVAWYTASTSIDEATLRSHARTALPRFMVPDRFFACPAFATLPNGKVDRRWLARRAAKLAADAAGNGYRPPQTGLQERLARLWADLLDVDRVGIEDNFYDLGGDSIIAMRLAARAHRQGLIVAPAQIIRHPTISDLSRYTSISNDFSTSVPAKFELAGLDADELDDLLDDLDS